MFDAVKFCKRHLSIKNWSSWNNLNYSKSELFSLCDAIIEVFKKESTLAKISPPVTIVGDIHGQFDDLVRILNSRSSAENGGKKYGFSTKRWVFLGDYVDRGPNSLECICLLFSLKLVFPKQYILLRGNHECRSINFTYGFHTEIRRRQFQAEEIWEKFNEAFAWMPLSCLVGGRILCMHGGIGPDLTSLEAIRNIPRPFLESEPAGLAQDLLWADPWAFNQDLNGNFSFNKFRGLSVLFSAEAVLEVCKRLNVSLIVRAHQMMPTGFKFFADRKLCTIFSAPRYMDQVNNYGAIMKVDETGKISILVIKKEKIQGESKQDEITQYVGSPSQLGSLNGPLAD